MDDTMLFGEWDGREFRMFDVAMRGLFCTWNAEFPDGWCNVASAPGEVNVTVDIPGKEHLPPCILRVRVTPTGPQGEYTEDGCTWCAIPER